MKIKTGRLTLLSYSFNFEEYRNWRENPQNKAIKEIVEKINSKFFNWFKQTLEFEISRTLQTPINFYSINFYIA